MFKTINTLSILVLLFVTSCAVQHDSVYAQLGGQKKIDEIVDNFVTEIEFDKTILPYFKGSNIKRFKIKLSEQICERTGGPCVYTGDSMEVVHTGMNITESDFNRTVDLLINAMDKANVPHRLQNQVINVFVPTRDEMLYK